MPYYYDLLVDLDDELWEYYEWEKNDNLLLFKKVPFVRVNELIMKDFLEYQISLDNEWVKPYINKAILKNNKKMTGVLFASLKETIFFEFDETGKVLGKSKVLIEDWNNIYELVGERKNESVLYEKSDKIAPRLEFRRALKDKHFLEIEINSLVEKQDKSKCAYIYFEFFGKNKDDFKEMIKELKEEIQRPYTLKMHEVVKLIKMTYKECL